MMVDTPNEGGGEELDDNTADDDKEPSEEEREDGKPDEDPENHGDDESADLKRQIEQLTTDVGAQRSIIEKLTDIVNAIQEAGAQGFDGGAEPTPSEDDGESDNIDDDGVHLTLQDIFKREGMN